MTKKPRHTLVDKRGNEILGSDSFGGFIGGLFAMMIGAFVILTIIALFFLWNRQFI